MLLLPEVRLACSCRFGVGLIFVGMAYAVWVGCAAAPCAPLA
jgi:hypothetical protein